MAHCALVCPPTLSPPLPLPFTPFSSFSFVSTSYAIASSITIRPFITFFSPSFIDIFTCCPAGHARAHMCVLQGSRRICGIQGEGVGRYLLQWLLCLEGQWVRGRREGGSYALHCYCPHAVICYCCPAFLLAFSTGEPLRH